ncbi:DUF262 domain-containing protein [Curtobacterium sp. VKM Ac-2861]|uniref:GmrSD restriction endonuclease domain-containing protein n=1 Tax=Curtobacterium sp. VKM Ac-2861 TaxID=2739016 RepID=UPI001566D539|nr:DUF262 domain-containing protein [Curtobacterium sp. VKM Ac-2861]
MVRVAAERADIGDGFDEETSAAITRDKWLKAQRDLVTTTLDYNLSTISRLVSDNSIDLDPSFQRRHRWDRRRQSQLIESFMMNVPLPPIFLNEDDFGSYSIIDGKQRLTAVSEFMRDGFALTGLDVFSEAEGRKFSELDRDLRSVLETRASLRAIIILRMSDPDIKYQVFQRLNTGGVRLNAQELRNVAYAGPLNDLLHTLAEYEPFRELLRLSDVETRQRSALWRQMRDVELVLRFFTLSRSWSRFSGSLVREMNDFMGSHKDSSGRELLALQRSFTETVDKVRTVFGIDAFRRPNARSGRPGAAVVASLFDAQMLGVQPFDADRVGRAKAELQQGMRALFADTDFTGVIGAATNTPSSVRERVQRVRNMVEAELGN